MNIFVRNVSLHVFRYLCCRQTGIRDDHDDDEEDEKSVFLYF